MPLNLRVNDGNFVPYLKYNAKAGRFFARFDGMQGDVEIVNTILAVDFANIKTGWIEFPQGGGQPQTLWDPNHNVEAKRPDWDKPRRGFRLPVVGRSVIQGAGVMLGARELTSNANSIIKVIIPMFDAWEAAVQDHPDEVPVYQCTGTVAVKGKHGTNYEPEFKLLKWVARESLPELQQVIAQDFDDEPDGASLDEPEGPYAVDDIPF